MTEDALHNAGQGLWLACVEQLSHDLPEQQYNTWIKPLTASVSEDFAKVTVYAPNRFKLIGFARNTPGASWPCLKPCAATA